MVYSSCWLPWIQSSETPEFSAEQIGFFEEKIRPVLVAKCYKCHSERSVKLKGGLHVDSREGLLKGGDSGEPSLVPGKPERSLFMLAIRHEEEDLAMPPKEKLSPGEIKDFANWIKMGVPFPVPLEESETAGANDEPAWWEKYKEGELLPRDKTIAQAVDHYVSKRLKSENVSPAAMAGENALLRRLALDLAGRIPTWAESQAYLESKEKWKLGNYVDLLLDSGSFARHMVNEFDWFLMGDRGGMRKYLETAFGDNKPWDKIFKDIILAEGHAEAPEQKELAKFLTERVKTQDKLTNDVAVAFFGINVSCAQCHDHPEVPSWKQDHYYGMKSFLSRIYTNGDFISEKEYGQVKFKTTKGVEKTGQLLFLDGTVFEEPESKEPKKEQLEEQKKELQKLAKEKKAPPKPVFSRRAKLVEAALGKQERAFCPARSSTAFGTGCSAGDLSHLSTKCTGRIFPAIPNSCSGLPGTLKRMATTSNASHGAWH